MKLQILLPFAAALCAASGLAQQPGQRLLDANGDYITGPGPDAPGAVCTQWNNIPSNDVDGVGIMPDGRVLIKDGGLAQVTPIDPSTGLQSGAVFPVAEVTDYGLGFDACRNLILTTNASTDVIRGYTPGNAVPVFEWPFPATGYVGIAHDTTRDLYWVCDWTTNEVIAYTPAGVETMRHGNASYGGTRLNGLAYDCLSDSLIVGARDQVMHYVLDPATGALKFSFPSLGLGASDPRGAAVSPGRGIWTSSYLTQVLAELETFVPCPGGPNLTLGTSPTGTAQAGTKLVVNVSNCGAELRAIVGASLSAGRSVIKGVQTCLSGPVTKLGVVNLVAGAGSLSFKVPNLPGRCLFIQGACLPSKTVTSMQSCRIVP